MEFPKTPVLCLLLVIGLTTVVQAADPEVITDFWPPEDGAPANGTYFTFTGFRDFKAAPGTFTIKKGAVDVFPALRGLGVSYSILEYYPETTNPVHTHPRGTELLYLIKGQLDVGLVDTSNKLYTQTLQEGDVFVFPKGLLHYQINLSPNVARAISAFSSSNPGTLSLPSALFSSGIPSVELETAFKVKAEVIHELESVFKCS